MKFTVNGKEYTLSAKPFWTSHAFETHRGLTGVARVDATSDGQNYMIDLIQSQLDAIISAPGYDLLPKPAFCPSVDTKRPRSNNPAKKISSTEDQQRVYDDLQNEGHDEPEFVDDAPYQKGDNHSQ